MKDKWKLFILKFKIKSIVYLILLLGFISYIMIDSIKYKELLFNSIILIFVQIIINSIYNLLVYKGLFPILNNTILFMTNEQNLYYSYIDKKSYKELLTNNIKTLNFTIKFVEIIQYFLLINLILSFVISL